MVYHEGASRGVPEVSPARAPEYTGKSQAVRPVGQAVKTAASHAANGSSILPRVTKIFVDNSFAVWYSREAVGVNSGEGTPVPIPNTVVKLVYGDNTWLATAREDSSTPTLKSNNYSCCFFCI